MPTITLFIAAIIILLALLAYFALRRGMQPLLAFIICLGVALLYLFPEVYGEMPEASGFRFKKIGQRCERKWDCDNGCCVGGECEDSCNDYDPPPPTFTPMPTATPIPTSTPIPTATPTPWPPSISGTLNCSQMGNNGWCVGSLSLNITASDPQGYAVIIAGSVNGTPFSCPGGNPTCSVSLPEGAGSVSYYVTSASELSSGSSLPYQRDSTIPQINGAFNGAVGADGWFISSVTLSASASDWISGIAALEYSVDNGPWSLYSLYELPPTLHDGTHTVRLRTSDLAGNRSETSQTVSIDTLTPALDLSLTGTPGEGGWYRSRVEVAGLRRVIQAQAWQGSNTSSMAAIGRHTPARLPC